MLLTALGGAVVGASCVGLLVWLRRQRRHNSRQQAQALARSPLTGDFASGGEPVPVFGSQDKQYDDIVNRQLHDVIEIPPVRIQAHELLPQHRPQIRGRVMSFEDEVQLLVEAWSLGDGPSLTLHANSELPSSGAAEVLLALWEGMFPAPGQLERLAAVCATTEPFAYLDAMEMEFVFPYEVPEWGLSGEVTNAKEGTCLLVASALVSRGHEGDALEAHWLLARARMTARVAMLRLVVLVEMGWWDELSDADTKVLGVFEPVGLYAQGVGAAMNGYEEEAVELLTKALAGLEEDLCQEAPGLGNKIMYARAVAKQNVGDNEGAWQDLVTISRQDENYPGVRELLKQV